VFTNEPIFGFSDFSEHFLLDLPFTVLDKESFVKGLSLRSIFL